jgi:hypothetical protein
MSGHFCQRAGVKYPRFLTTIHTESTDGLNLVGKAPRLVAAVAFAAHQQRGGRLAKAIGRLVELAYDVERRYVFFVCPGFSSGRQVDIETVSGVEVWSIAVSIPRQSRGL